MWTPSNILRKGRSEALDLILGAYGFFVRLGRWRSRGRRPFENIHLRLELCHLLLVHLDRRLRTSDGGRVGLLAGGDAGGNGGLRRPPVWAGAEFGGGMGWVVYRKALLF